jgi:hypothetical protein
MKLIADFWCTRAILLGCLTFTFISLNANALVQCGLPGEKLQICRACSETVSPEQRQVIQEIFGELSHRRWHSEWHEIRAWEFVSPQRRTELLATGNVPMNLAEYQMGSRLGGENFLFMHREMIKMLQAGLTKRGLDCVAPWTALPATIYDSQWPVPDAVSGVGDLQIINSVFSGVKTEERDIANYNWTGSSLNDLGYRAELGSNAMHGPLHWLYQKRPLQCKSGRDVSPTCDDLVTTWAAAVNPHFWKLHGFIDNLVAYWMTANQISEISTECKSRPGCYQWSGTWVGGMPHHQ